LYFPLRIVANSYSRLDYSRPILLALVHKDFVPLFQSARNLSLNSIHPRRAVESKHEDDRELVEVVKKPFVRSAKNELVGVHKKFEEESKCHLGTQ